MSKWRIINNTAINEKSLLESIAKTSKATLITFAAQPGKLAEAAYQAKRVGLELNDIKNLIFTDAPSDYNFQDTVQLMDINLNVDYIYLDTVEQREFANAKHRYLIEQLQYSGSESINANSTTKRVKLVFNLPIKELFWVNQLDSVFTINDIFNYSTIAQLADYIDQLNDTDSHLFSKAPQQEKYPASYQQQRLFLFQQLYART